jgi:hypothetical protein
MLALLATVTSALLLQPANSRRGGMPVCEASTTANLYDPAVRMHDYEDNIAQYLVDLHDSRGTFDFCGGMLFQLVLSDALRAYLAGVGKGSTGQPVVFDANTRRMAQIPGYVKSQNADNVRVFHGREVRQVPDAAGGQQFVLHLSLANGDDPEGWTPQELARYDGWGHDSGREWRKAEQLEREGFSSFSSKFGEAALGLHHRFYLHLDQEQRLWLSAEDGCEGVVSKGRARKPGWLPL